MLCVTSSSSACGVHQPSIATTGEALLSRKIRVLEPLLWSLSFTVTAQMIDRSWRMIDQLRKIITGNYRGKAICQHISKEIVWEHRRMTGHPRTIDHPGKIVLRSLMAIPSVRVSRRVRSRIRRIGCRSLQGNLGWDSREWVSNQVWVSNQE